MPVGLLYTSGVCDVFRGRVTLGLESDELAARPPLSVMPGVPVTHGAERPEGGLAGRLGRHRQGPVAPVSAERRIVALDRAARRWLLLAVLTGFGAAVALIGQLVAVAIAAAGVFLEDRTLEAVLPLLAAAFALLGLRAALVTTSELAARRAAARLVDRVRSDVTGHLLRLGPAHPHRERSGETAALLIGGLEALEEYVTSYLPARWLAMLIPLLVLATVFVLDPPSVLVLLFTGPLLLLLLAVIGGRTKSVTERRFLELRVLSAFFLDILRGVATLKMFGRSREQIDNLRTISQRYGDATMEVLRTAFQTSLVLEWGATIAIALVAVEVGLRLLADAIAFERALAVLLIVPEFFLPLRQLAIRYHLRTAGRAAIERTFTILDTPVPGARGRSAAPDLPGGTTSSPAPILSAPPSLVFEGVSLTYPGRALPALDSVTLDIPAGRMLALVGATGAGKSTLASLLLRFLEPDAGRILVDGEVLAGLDVRAWRASLAWVPQRPHLVHGSIAENIRLARPGASAGEVAAAARAANAEDFIARLPGGLESSVGEAGGRLSGGQRQRIAIARAFLRDAPLLVLDEATSYQDEESEVAIAAALERLTQGRTVLVISHRLRLARRADRVAVLAAGRLVELGPPDALADAGGPFSALLDAGSSAAPTRMTPAFAEPAP